MKSTPAVPGWLGSASVALALFLLPLPDSLIERVYSRSLYPVWQRGVTRLSNLAPFALFDLLLILVVALTLWRMVRLVGRLRRGAAMSALWEGTRRVVRAAASLALVFLLMWGLNYRRVPLDRTVPPARPSVDELRAVLAETAAAAATFRAASVPGPAAIDDVTSWLRAPFEKALVRLRRPPLGTPGRPKHSVVMTPFFTAAGVDGMIDPFALETIVHPDLLPFERPFVVAHEWAHLAGAADEAEASAIGWVACMNGGPDLAYSGSLYLIMELAGALPRRIWLADRVRLDGGILADLSAIAERQRRQRPRIQRAAFRAYDSYLKANRVDDGVASYSRALSLILSPALRDVRLSGGSPGPSGPGNAGSQAPGPPPQRVKRVGDPGPPPQRVKRVGDPGPEGPGLRPSVALNPAGRDRPS